MKWIDINLNQQLFDESVRKLFVVMSEFMSRPHASIMKARVSIHNEGKLPTGDES